MSVTIEPLDCGMHEELTRSGELLDTVQLFFGVGLDRDQLVAKSDA